MLKTSTELLPFGHKFTYKKSAWSDQREVRPREAESAQKEKTASCSWALGEANDLIFT
jgi:hypothetical protein